jgi:hypothetical protein
VWGSGTCGIANSCGITQTFGATASQFDLINDTSPFVGTGTVGVTLSATTLRTGLFGENYLVEIDSTRANALGVLTYDYSPIPEPSTWALMIAGLAGLGFVARRRTSA